MRRRTPRVHVRPCLDAASHAPCTRAHMTWCSVTRPRHLCAHAVVQRHTSACPASPFLARTVLYPFVTKSKIVRSLTSAAVGGTGVLDSTSDLYRCGSGACSSCRGHSGCVHASGNINRKNRCSRNFQPVAASHLSTSRDVTSGLTARIRRSCHERSEERRVGKE